ncbi:hypothetical protein N7471_011050 [Penicillium samsonianum]|uniref:uncharacterized protein n=1 Tax=Penicillium samsonianum TaxID=1882272 RepID=UPI002547B27C|nr:uncharacterized protein N7471_011050 [Penicillium samsonianum]KAJ6123733.1 hypothetical protein N7471_011050 [Penicillium samsonianum]
MDENQDEQNQYQLLLGRIEPAVRRSTNRSPPYFWGEARHEGGQETGFPIHRGYAEIRSIIEDGRLELLEDLANTAIQYITREFECLESSKEGTDKGFVELHLSEDLQKWRREQHYSGRTLPSKGYGLASASDKVVQLFGAEKWPKPLTTTNALFGSGMMNMLIGAYDAETLYSNYCTDMAFYYEHGYHEAFPEFEETIKLAVSDHHAVHTPGGAERRAAVEIGMKYIKAKVALEEAHKSELANRVAKLNRREAQVIFCFECSLLGMAKETMVRGFDCGAVMSDMIFSSPGTDVVDVGSDLINSELVNSFLNTADMTSTGIVTEEALRRVYDAYAHTGSRMLCERWMEPMARMCSVLFTWHIQNDRHRFFRRALLGYPKARKTAAEPREADFDEAFDPELRTTGFSRPLQGACNGGDPCDQVEGYLRAHDESDGLLAELWLCLSTKPMQYVSKGVVDAEIEDGLSERLLLTMARAYSLGFADEMAWLLAHAGHHAWQVNRLFEAAMFGSLLDDGDLRGKLDR